MSLSRITLEYQSRDRDGVLCEALAIDERLPETIYLDGWCLSQGGDEIDLMGSFPVWEFAGSRPIHIERGNRCGISFSLACFGGDPESGNVIGRVGIGNRGVRAILAHSIGGGGSSMPIAR